MQDIINSALQLPLEMDAIRQARTEVLQTMLITTATSVEPDRPAITVGGIGALALSNISAVKAKQKQGKTTALTVIVSAVLAGQCFRVESPLDEPTVLWMDTEQSDFDSKLIIERIRQLTRLDDEYIDDHFKLLNVRRYDTNERILYLKEAITTFRPSVVIIDGVVDLAGDFNDPIQSKLLINELLRISSEHRLAIVTVLHTNKADGDHAMRGHLGTMLSQKAATVLECEKEDNIITVKCSDYRHAQLPTFSLRFDEFGGICEADLAYAELQERKLAQRENEREQRKAEILAERQETVLNILSSAGGKMPRKELIDESMLQLNKSYGTVSGIVTHLKNSGKIVESNGSVYFPS